MPPKRSDGLSERERNGDRRLAIHPTPREPVQDETTETHPYLRYLPGGGPCWETDCPISEKFICDDCAEDAIESADPNG